MRRPCAAVTRATGFRHVEQDGAAAILAAIGEGEPAASGGSWLAETSAMNIPTGAGRGANNQLPRAGAEAVLVAVMFPAGRIGEDQIVGGGAALEERGRLGLHNAAALGPGLD